MIHSWWQDSKGQPIHQEPWGNPPRLHQNRRRKGFTWHGVPRSSGCPQGTVLFLCCFFLFFFFLRVFVLHPGIPPLGNDPEWFKITRFYPEMCINGGQYLVVFPGCTTKPLTVLVFAVSQMITSSEQTKESPQNSAVAARTCLGKRSKAKAQGHVKMRGVPSPQAERLPLTHTHEIAGEPQTNQKGLTEKLQVYFHLVQTPGQKSKKVQQ